jgi:hypothetical protein
MNPKEYLEQVARAEREIKILSAKIAHYEEFGLSITSHFGDAPVRASTPSSRVETAAIGVVDTLGEWNAKLGAYRAFIDRAEKLIDRVPQERYRDILKFRYLCGWDLQKVGAELQYRDRNSIYRAHGYALLAMKRVLEEAKDGEL